MSPLGDGTLESLVSRRLVFTDLPAGTLEEVFTQLSRRLSESGVVRDPEELERRLLEREKLGCTGLGSGIAIPHLKLKGISEVVVAIARFREGIDFHAPDREPVTLLFLVLSPSDSPALHLQALARISRFLRTPGVADNLRRAASPEEMLETLKETPTSSAPVRA